MANVNSSEQLCAALQDVRDLLKEVRQEVYENSKVSSSLNTDLQNLKAWISNISELLNASNGMVTRVALLEQSTKLVAEEFEEFKNAYKKQESQRLATRWKFFLATFSGIFALLMALFKDHILRAFTK